MGLVQYGSLLLNGNHVTALPDSGGRESVIKNKLFSPSQIRQTNMWRCVLCTGIPNLPSSPRYSHQRTGLASRVKVGVPPFLPEKIILGTDNPYFFDLLLSDLTHSSNPHREEPVVDAPVQDALLAPEPWHWPS